MCSLCHVYLITVHPKRMGSTDHGPKPPQLRTQINLYSLEVNYLRYGELTNTSPSPGLPSGLPNGENNLDIRNRGHGHRSSRSDFWEASVIGWAENGQSKQKLTWCCPVRREFTSSCAMEGISHEALITTVLEELNRVNKKGLGNLG